MPNSALTEDLKGKTHWDWPPGLRWVPRAWTSYKWGVPVMSYGNQKDVKNGQDLDGVVRAGPAPIGEPGSWQVSEFPGAPWQVILIPALTVMGAVWLPGWWRLVVILALPFQPFYAAFTLRSGRQFRMGARWDNVGSYTTIPAASLGARVYKGGDLQDTSTR